jgi:hypothetical protein
MQVAVDITTLDLILGAGTVWNWAVLPTVQKNILPPSSGLK